MTVALFKFEHIHVRKLNYSDKSMLPFFNPENFSFLDEFYSQIMAGDDSSTEKREEFHLGRSTPPPTTSYVSASNKYDYNFDIKTVAEPSKEDKDDEKDKDKDNKDDIDISRSDSNPDEIKRRDEGEEPKIREKREGGHERDGSGGDKEKPQKKIDGSDVLDGQWIPPKDSKLQLEDEEDDNCTVKCLYYTMQCCECSIS